MQYCDLNTWLKSDILVKGDRLSMGNSLEVRVPYLDKEVFEAAKVLLTKDLGGISYETVVASQGETEAIISVLSIRLCQVINSYVTVTNE